VAPDIFLFFRYFYARFVAFFHASGSSTDELSDTC